MTDLDSALEFVFRRIEEQAAHSGQPLSEEERELLHHLPKHPTQQPGVTPQIWGDGAFEIQLPVPDVPYERLCALAKAAHRLDGNSDPKLKASWEFAASVTKLGRHPVAWLLNWAGVRVARPWWDRLLLVAFALFVFILGLTLMFAFTEKSLRSLPWVTAAVICAALLLMLFTSTRRIESRQLQHNIKRSRQQMDSHDG